MFVDEDSKIGRLKLAELAKRFRKLHEHQNKILIFSKQCGRLELEVVSYAFSSDHEHLLTCSSLSLFFWHDLSNFGILPPSLVNTSITELEVSSYPIGYQGFVCILDHLFFQLTSIVLVQCNIDSIPKSRLERCTQLKKLNLSLNPLDNRCIPSLLDSLKNSLQILAVNNTSLITEIPESSLEDCHFLRKLEMNDNPIQNIGLGIILSSLHQSLESLYVQNCQITEIPIELYHDCKHLKELSISRNMIKGSGYNTVFSSRENVLEVCYMHSCGISVLDFKFGRNVRVLNLNSNSIDSRGLDLVLMSFFRSLEYLDAGNCKISEIISCDNLERCQFLRVLILVNNNLGVGKPGGKRLLKSFKKMPWLKEFQLKQYAYDVFLEGYFQLIRSFRYQTIVLLLSFTTLNSAKFKKC